MKQTSTPPQKRGLIALSAVLAALSLPVAAQQSDDADVEEIVVTGSLIRGTPLDAPSPVQITSREDIAASGAATVFDVIRHLEVNSGAFSNVGGVQEGGNSERSQFDGVSFVNLRNLGENSTLTLINGKRMSPAAGITNSGGEVVNLNDIPIVMTERVEVLTDGGSALYGSDAVAGVVNLIMRTEFEGFELYADIQGVEAAGGAFDSVLSGIWGWASEDERTRFVVAAESFTRDPVTVLDGNHIDENSEFVEPVSWTLLAGTSPLAVDAFSHSLNPTYINMTVTGQNAAERMADGRPPSGFVFYDPLCTDEALNTMLGTNFQIGEKRENRGERTGTCYEDTAEFNFLARDTARTTFSAAFSHSFSDRAEFYSFVNHSENEIILQGGSINNTGGSTTSRGPVLFLAQPGAHHLMGVAAVGVPPGVNLGRTMELGYFANHIGLMRPTAMDITNAPVDIRNGGINVVFNSFLRDGIPRDGERSNTTNTDALLAQLGLRGDFTRGDRPWNYDVSVSWSQTNNEQSYHTFDRFRSELAANGLGGPNCTPDGVRDFDFLSAGNVSAGELAQIRAIEGMMIPGLPFFPVGTADALSQLPSAWNPQTAGFVQRFFPGFVFHTREALSLALTSTNHGQGDCMFYNPFLTRFTNPNVANDPALLEWMNVEVLRADKRNTLTVFEAVVSGELFDMAGGAAAVAFGVQQRGRITNSKAPTINRPGVIFDNERYRRLYSNVEQEPGEAILGYDMNGVPNEFHMVENNLECSNCAFNFNHERTVTALFAEFSLPFAENVETQLAMRWEDYGGNIGAQLSPKLALSWRPNDNLLLRGSWSQSFRAPNIDIVEQGFESGSITFRDPISNQRVRAGLLPATAENGETEQTFTVGIPAPDVGNESADTLSLGFIWESPNGFRFQADYWSFAVEDRVLPQPGISAVQPELDRFNEILNSREDMINGMHRWILNDSISGDGGRSFNDDGTRIPEGGTFVGTPGFDKPCDPDQLAMDHGADSEERRNCVINPLLYTIQEQGIGISRSFRNEDADLITLSLAAINAGQIEANGIDIAMDYDWRVGAGELGIGITYTHVNEYKLIDVPGLERGLMDTGRFDAAGTTGNFLHVRSLPDNKGAITFTWRSGSHGLTFVNRHIGSYEDLAYDSAFFNANDFVRSLLSRKIDSYSTWDMQYTYSQDFGGSNAVFTAGVLDMLNADIPYRESNSGQRYDATVFDPRGRRLYARVLWRF